MDSDSIQEFKKTFNINTDTSDIKFSSVSLEPYKSIGENHKFGETLCVLHMIKCTMFNLRFHLRILSFKYENEQIEVLKLQITVLNEILATEIASCRNFLQRKRNLNLAFEVLLKFARLYEMRRLICRTVFKKHNATITSADSGIHVKFCNKGLHYMDVNWTISWNIKDYEVADFIEFYLNKSALSKSLRKQIREKLKILVMPNYDFHHKLKLWKLLMEDMYGVNLFSTQCSGENANETDVLEISDSEGDPAVIEIDDSLCLDSLSDEILVID